MKRFSLGMKRFVTERLTLGLEKRTKNTHRAVTRTVEVLVI